MREFQKRNIAEQCQMPQGSKGRSKLGQSEEKWLKTEMVAEKLQESFFYREESRSQVGKGSKRA